MTWESDSNDSDSDDSDQDNFSHLKGLLKESREDDDCLVHDGTEVNDAGDLKNHELAVPSKRRKIVAAPQAAPKSVPVEPVAVPEPLVTQAQAPVRTGPRRKPTRRRGQAPEQPQQEVSADVVPEPVTAIWGDDGLGGSSSEASFEFEGFDSDSDGQAAPGEAVPEEAVPSVMLESPSLAPAPAPAPPVAALPSPNLGPVPGAALASPNLQLTVPHLDAGLVGSPMSLGSPNTDVGLPSPQDLQPPGLESGTLTSPFTSPQDVPSHIDDATSPFDQLPAASFPSMPQDVPSSDVSSLASYWAAACDHSLLECFTTIEGEAAAIANSINIPQQEDGFEQLQAEQKKSERIVAGLQRADEVFVANYVGGTAVQRPVSSWLHTCNSEVMQKFIAQQGMIDPIPDVLQVQGAERGAQGGFVLEIAVYCQISGKFSKMYEVRSDQKLEVLLRGLACPLREKQRLIEGRDPTGFLHAGGVFFSNKTEGATDYVAPIKDWAPEGDNPWRDREVRDMASSVWGELKVGLGDVMVYRHHGKCDHKLRVMRVSEDSDPSVPMPRCVYATSAHVMQCEICKANGAAFIMLNSPNHPLPAYTCQRCYDLLHPDPTLQPPTIPLAHSHSL